MALHALSLYATINSGEFVDLTITVNGAPMFNIDRSNYLLQQSQDLPVCIIHRSRHQLPVNRFFLKEINTCIQQGCIKFKSDCKDI